MIKHILVVDDSTEIHPIINAILSSESVQVTSATDPGYGLTLAGSMKPDLILLDVDMPGMDGYEFCRQMKANAEMWAVPVIFLTARSNTDQKVQGLHLGAVDYIAKPFSPTELLARVAGALRTQSVITNLQKSSLIDTLTGLGNGRMFETRLRGEISERERSPKPLSCAYIDVDGFQNINKFYGEPFGDQVLRKVSEAIRAVFRPEDVPCRLNGDDFAVLLPDTELADAMTLSQKLKNELSTASLRYRDATIPVTCGIGLSTARGLYDHQVLERAKDAIEKGSTRNSNGLWFERETDVVTTASAA